MMANASHPIEKLRVRKAAPLAIMILSVNSFEMQGQTFCANGAARGNRLFVRGLTLELFSR